MMQTLSNLRVPKKSLQASIPVQRGPFGQAHFAIRHRFQDALRDLAHDVTGDFLTVELFMPCVTYR
jgi:hypothetical protein